MNKVTPTVVAESNYFGVAGKKDGIDNFWRFSCPCGVVATYPINGLPEVDTPHPCGNPKHWTVKIFPNAGEKT